MEAVICEGCVCFHARRVADDSLKRRNLERAVQILRKPEAKRCDEDVKFVTRFLGRIQFHLRFFRNKPRQRLEWLARVMTAVVAKPNAVIYNQGDTATNMHVVVDGSVGMYVPEDVEEQTEYESYLQKLRILFLAGKSAEAQRTSERALEAAKAVANVDSEHEFGLDPAVDTDVKALANLSATVANVDHIPTTDEVQWDDGWVDDGKLSDAKTPRQRWLWGFKRIVVGLRAGKFVNILLSRHRVYDGKSLVQLRLVRKGFSFGETDLFHPSRTRATTVFAKSRVILFSIPRDAYVAMRDAEEKTGDLCDDVRFLSNLPWLKELPSDVVTRLALRSHKRDHSKGTLILSEGSRDLMVCCVLEGQVRVVCHGKASLCCPVDADGKPVLSPKPVLRSHTVYNLGLLCPGQWFGEKPLLTGLPNDFGFVADSPVTLLVIPARAFFPIRRKCSHMLLDNLDLVQSYRAKRLVQLVKQGKDADEPPQKGNRRSALSSLVLSPTSSELSAMTSFDGPARLTGGASTRSVYSPTHSQVSAGGSLVSPFKVQPKNAGIPLRVSTPHRPEQASPPLKLSHSQRLSPTELQVDAGDSLWSTSAESYNGGFMSPIVVRSNGSSPMEGEPFREKPSLASLTTPGGFAHSMNSAHLLKSPTLTRMIPRLSSEPSLDTPTITPQPSMTLLPPAHRQFVSEGTVCGTGRTVAQPSPKLPSPQSLLLSPKASGPSVYLWRSNSVKLPASVPKHSYSCGDIRQFYKSTATAMGTDRR